MNFTQMVTLFAPENVINHPYKAGDNFHRQHPSSLPSPIPQHPGILEDLTKSPRKNLVYHYYCVSESEPDVNNNNNKLSVSQNPNVWIAWEKGILASLAFPSSQAVLYSTLLYLCTVLYTIVLSNRLLYECTVL